MDLVPIALSIAALVISIASFILSILAHRRDSGKVHAWSTILWEEVGKLDENSEERKLDIHIMKIRIRNGGRRPVSVLNLVMESEDGSKWFRSFQRPKFDKESISIDEFVQEVHQRSAAHLLAVRLDEDQAFEAIYRSEENFSFLSLRHEPPAWAKRLYVEDLSGKLYPVKDSVNNLDIFLGGEVSQ